MVKLLVVECGMNSVKETTVSTTLTSLFVLDDVHVRHVDSVLCIFLSHPTHESNEESERESTNSLIQPGDENRPVLNTVDLFTLRRVRRRFHDTKDSTLKERLLCLGCVKERVGVGIRSERM